MYRLLFRKEWEWWGVVVKLIDVDREGYSMELGWKELAQWLGR